MLDIHNHHCITTKPFITKKNNASNQSLIQTNTAYRQGFDDITILSYCHKRLAIILRRSEGFYSNPCIDINSPGKYHAQKSTAKPYNS